MVEINDQIVESLNTGNTTLLMHTFSKYKSIVKTIFVLNKFCRLTILFAILLCTPINDLFLYSSQQNNNHIFLRITSIFLFVNDIIMLYVICYLCASMSTLCHKFRQLLHSFQINSRLSLRQRLQVMYLNDWLSESCIGFYCYVLFPINMYEFFDYCCKFCTTYFLIMGLIS